MTFARLSNLRPLALLGCSARGLVWHAPQPQLQAQPQLQPESEPLVSPVRLGEHGAVGFGVSSC